ncbi:leucine rich repeat (LRR) protein [Allofrancisella inopinata]|uniref:F-box/LRR-repeat protein 15-like leucin rich repeat domain-containing protein n=1 Tax=Allofrancisella inopinata TaxID=1085647 RepID=A0AAE7CQ92_9GAMM|nr:hypothetical protein [Allofrancisella inopinata]QIV95477.1 hypothetical protein E4K63_00930 [Allofrancisella inopinata]TDT72612.1 leucine rich repeat (LRR) protein [Allofrancisella inopinata]
MWDEEKNKLIEKAVDNFVNGRKVDLSNSNLTEKDVIILVEKIRNPSVKKNKDIKFPIYSLNLNGNHEIGDQSVKHLSKLEPLQNLYLSNCGITDQGVEHIANKLTNLVVLNLSKNNISGNGIGAIANKLHKLESLDISENAFGWLGVKALSKFKKLNLQTLNISNDELLKEELQNLIDVSYGNVFLDLIECLPKKLISLNIAGYQQLDDRIAYAITKKYKQAKYETQLRSLKSLNLSGCSISDQGVKILIAHLWLLSSLNLSNCKNITDLSLDYIAKGSTHPEHLNPTRLNFSNCNQITSKGIEYLNKCNDPLKYLNLSGFKEIPLISLSKLKSLQSLDLSGSNISFLIAKALITDIPSLKYLGISNCKNITPKDLEKLQINFQERKIKIKGSESPYQDYPTSRFNINYYYLPDSE